MPTQNTKRLMLIDGNALVHRAYHALPHLTTKDGRLVNAVYGFTSMLLNALQDLKPDYAAVTFDLPKPTFRHVQYEQYKAKRIKAPQELYDQIPIVKYVVKTLNIPIFAVEGYEADDVIGTLVEQATNQNIESIIVTGDQDTLQLVGPLTKVYTARKGLKDTTLFGPVEVKEKFGLNPEQLVDYKALAGDQSDNIPGVPGIGQKTAAELIAKYGTLKKLYQNLSELKPRLRQILTDHKDEAKFSQKLVTLVKNIPIKLNLGDCRVSNYDQEQVLGLFEELGFKSLIKRLPFAQKLAIIKSSSKNQLNLFKT